ncbi:MAG: hypothetical protein AB9900_04925 [Humidesulfovibrio sp.]
MQEISAERLHAIIESEAVSRAIAQVAEHDKALVPIARDRAHEALQVAVELSAAAGRDVTDEALESITVCAVETLLPDATQFALHHRVNGWLGGPAVVPDNLRFSWEPGPKLKKAPPTPRDFDPDKEGLIGDPTALREHMVGTTAPIPEITTEREAELVKMQNQGALADTALLAFGDTYKALGRIEGMDFLRRVGDIAIAQTFVEVRESKKYKGLPYKDAGGNLRHVEDFDEFCREFFGKSYTRCYELSKNLHLLGPDLYESAERIGFKSRDYAALKALPESEQDIVKTALAAESKDQVLDILQDLAARHQSERAAAKKDAEDLKADLDARDKLLTEKTEKNDRLSLELEKLKSLPPNKRARLQLEQEQAAALRINTACVKAEGEVNLFLAEVADVLALDELSQTTTAHAMNSVRFLCESLSEFLAAHNIDVDFAGMARPEWRRDLAAQDLGVKEGE